MKQFEVGNFTFKLLNLKTVEKDKLFKYKKVHNDYSVKIYFKGDEITTLPLGANFKKGRSIEVAANEEKIMVKTVNAQPERKTYLFPHGEGYATEASKDINVFDVNTGKLLETNVYREDERKADKAEEDFKNFNQPSLEL